MRFILLMVFSMNLHAHVKNDGSNNVTNICQPRIKIVQASCKKAASVYKTRVKYRTKRVNIYRKNRIKVLAGSGPTGVDLKSSSNSASLYEKRGLIMGVSYDRMLNKQISVGGQVQTNETYLIGIGFDF